MPEPRGLLGSEPATNQTAGAAQCLEGSAIRGRGLHEKPEHRTVGNALPWDLISRKAP
jgi:hypothetical protein